ncbi:ABC transporter ATP-binding protein [Terrabacter sp. 2RAF25]|uniref:ABC transporter ATP-binding protein n=1 Tax=Terrabacter sp. 2RAF25 TaxID=3232998 RepID=UPI003F9EB9D8
MTALPGPSARSALAVTCEGAARTFGRGERAVVAVHGSSCEVPFGSRIAIVGPSGSGKSTLLHIMAGLETPTAGRVSWPGLPATEPERRGQVGVVFQSPSLVPALTVAENVALPLILAGLPDADAEERVTEALQLVEVTELARQLPEELSGGQAQRVAVARVLASRPALILADEPTGQLDRANGQHLVDVILATAEQLDAALVVATHDIEVADRLKERWQMNEGRLSTVDAGLSRSRAPRGPHAGTAVAGDRR